jgi:hypothetical protein
MQGDVRLAALVRLVLQRHPGQQLGQVQTKVSDRDLVTVAVELRRLFLRRILSVGNDHILIMEVNSLTAKDSGEYKVVAKTPAGEAQANLSLNIQSTKLER